MLSKLIEFIKRHQEDIILFIGVILISLFFFAMGYIVAKEQEKTPLKIEFYENSHCWGGNNRSLSGLEIS